MVRIHEILELSFSILIRRQDIEAFQRTFSTSMVSFDIDTWCLMAVYKLPIHQYTSIDS